MKEKYRIQSQKIGSLNETDRLQIACPLIKAGYSVRLGREKPVGKKTSTYTYFVEYWEES